MIYQLDDPGLNPIASNLFGPLQRCKLSTTSAGVYIIALVAYLARMGTGSEQSDANGGGGGGGGGDGDFIPE